MGTFQSAVSSAERPQWVVERHSHGAKYCSVAGADCTCITPINAAFIDRSRFPLRLFVTSLIDEFSQGGDRCRVLHTQSAFLW